MSVQPDPAPQVIDLRAFVDVLRRRKWTVAFVTILVIGLALGFIYVRTPVYTSTSRVEVRPLTTDALLTGLSADTYVNMDTEAARVVSEPVAAIAAPMIGAAPNSGVTADVSVAVPTSTTYLDISCTKLTPEQALACATAFANAYVKVRVDTAKGTYDEAIGVEQKKIDTAQQRSTPTVLNSRRQGRPRRRTSRARSTGSIRSSASKNRRSRTCPRPNPNAAVDDGGSDAPIPSLQQGLHHDWPDRWDPRACARGRDRLRAREDGRAHRGTGTWRPRSGHRCWRWSPISAAGGRGRNLAW